MNAPIDADEAGDPTAPLVVVVHGSMDRSAGMLRLSRRLDNRYRVARYDRRGYGRSAPHDGPFDMAAQVADLLAVMAGRQAMLIGHSYGGNVALATAARHPEAVVGVAIYESPLSWEPWWPGTTAGAAAVATQGDPADAAERFMRRLIGDARWEALPQRTRDQRRAEGAAMVGELTDLRLHRPWSPADVHVPVVIGYGSRGADHHRDGMRRAAESLPGSTLVELANCRHDAPLSHPDLFDMQIVATLARMVGGRWDVSAPEP
jgi:pimeloyl-ACP methyl ester carboxylesterase